MLGGIALNNFSADMFLGDGSNLVDLVALLSAQDVDLGEAKHTVGTADLLEKTGILIFLNVDPIPAITSDNSTFAGERTLLRKFEFAEVRVGVKGQIVLQL